MTRSTKSTKEIKEPQNSYMIIKFGYSENIILPFKDGLKLIEATEFAGKMKDTYGEEMKVYPLARSDFEISYVTEQAYKEACLRGFLAKDSDE